MHTRIVSGHNFARSTTCATGAREPSIITDIPSSNPLRMRLPITHPTGHWLGAGNGMVSVIRMDTDFMPAGHGPAVYAHRVAFELHTGTIPAGMSILHHCDNPPCVRPDHLFLGTHDDNMADMKRKGRNFIARGSAHPRHKLTEVAVQQIRLRLTNGDRVVDLAAQYGVRSCVISNIKAGRLWRHVA